MDAAQAIADAVRQNAKELGQAIASALLDDPRFRLLAREMALWALVEQEEVRKMGLARSLIATFQARGMRIYLKGGQVRVYPREKLDAELSRLLVECKEEVGRFLAKYEKLEAAARMRDRSEYERRWGKYAGDMPNGQEKK